MTQSNSSARNVPIGEERGETGVFAGYGVVYICLDITLLILLTSFANAVLSDCQLWFCNKNRAKLLSNMANRCTKVALTRIRSNTHIVTFQVKNSTTVTQSQHIWYLCQLVRSQFNFTNYYLWRETNRGAQRRFHTKLIFMKGLFRLSRVFSDL